MINPKDSNLITFMRFPMILGIVLIHLHFVIPKTFNEVHDLSLYNVFVSLLYDGPTRIFVPLFFFISGFLFYGDNFTVKKYLIKLRKRFFSLIIPYFFYISLAIIAFYIVQLFFPILISDGKTAIADYKIGDWLKAYGIGGLPFVGPFWFIRNLFLIVLVSPIIYYYNKYLKVFGLILLGLVWILDVKFWTFIPQSSDVFFFSTGAFYGINGRCFTTDCIRLKYFSILYIPVILYCLLNNQEHESIIFRLSILLGMIMFINACTYIANKVNINSELTDASFMIFALHEPYMDQINKIILKILPVAYSDTILNIEYIFSLIIVATIIVVGISHIHKMLITHFPTIAKIINGNR